MTNKKLLEEQVPIFLDTCIARALDPLLNDHLAAFPCYLIAATH
jgi:hypothetical protein